MISAWIISAAAIVLLFAAPSVALLGVCVVAVAGVVLQS